MREIRSKTLRYGLALGSFALILLITIGTSRLFPFRVDLSALFIIIMIASAWYLGRGPGLVVAVLFEVALDYFSTAPLTARSSVVIFNRLLLFSSVVLFASSRRNAEKRLHDQREWLQVTLKSIGDAVIATDVNGKINFVNPTAERILGWSQSEAITQRMDEVFRVINENTREPVEGPFSAIKRKGSIVGLANHTLLLTRDGREVPIEDSGAPITDSSGNIIGVIVVFHDVSERRRAEQERERLLESERSARHQAEISDRLKDEFLATVSHELRTPLNAILGWSAMINLGTLDPDMIKNALGIIERNAKAQAEIISDILDVSRIINGKLCVVSHPLEMGPIVRSAVDTLTVAAAAKKITLAVSLDADERFVAGDPDRLQQVVWNLVSNAIKFTPQNGRIDITLSSVNSHLELKVADNGIGIDPKILPFVFERFRQADSSMTRHHGGLGLGLAIVRHLVELHGGTVSAESSGAGQGAAFTVRLPVARCQDSYPDLATIGTGTNDQDLEAVSSIANSGGLDG